MLWAEPDGPTVCDEQSALDLIGDAFGAEVEVVVVPVARLCADFFRLRSGVAGAVTQKFVNYRVRLVVVGEPTANGPTSGPVEDWMRESNRSRALWFVEDEAELNRRLEDTPSR